MVVGGTNINNIMSGIENTGNVKQHSHKKKLKQRFDIIKKLGQGTFGKVQLGINKETGQEVAIKTIKKSKIDSEADLVRIRREIQIMSSVQHPNIIHIYEVFENREKMVLVMEYAAGGELYDYLSEKKILNEDEARRIFRQIATACYYCHKHKICHRDLKLENILLDENNNAKIADFGLSNVFDDQRLLNTFCGSPLYASPEIVKGTPYHGPEVDCWSLGVLLYTLVYGAMPFDGGNFKRLVKQISQGDYFEPAKPSPASPLIREMLTVNPKNRANIEKICTHWWVNENYDINCLEISEELANQTPVRLDLLLSLAPPPPQLESDKLVVTEDVAEDLKTESVPTRSQSAGSLMELSHPEKRIKDLLNEEKSSPKRKLENAVSTDQVNEKRKDKIIKENTVADIRGTIEESLEDSSMTEAIPLDKSLTQTISKPMDVETETSDPSLQGAACAEIIEEAKKNEIKKPNKVKKTTTSTKVLAEINENPSQENVDKENEEAKTQEKQVKKKTVKKKVLSDKNEATADEKKEEKAEEPAKPVERRKSRIFEAAEKFQNMMSPTTETKSVVEKPKKILIPGVSVDGFKKEFERKASLTSTSPPKVKATPSKKVLIDKPSEPKPEPPKEPPQDERKEQIKNAVNIISSALDKEGARKSKSRPCCVRKPPVPFGVGGRSASGNIGLLSPLSPPIGPKPFVRPNFDPKPEAKKVEEAPEEPVEENKTSSAEITLKSATLPRRKTAKAEIHLNYPMPKPATMEFKTEMAHNVAAPPPKQSQRSEVVVPVAEFKEEAKNSPKERIIPIAFEEARENVQSPPAKPPMPRPFQSQKSNQSQRSGSISRQSTQDSDTEPASGEPIKKSPREYIIPIAVEGGGYVTPRAGSLEPSETASTTSTMTSRSKNKFGKARRLNSLLSDRDSEDESSFPSVYRHSSFGKDSDTEDSRKDAFHLHRLRSTRPKRTLLEHNDSLSSGEEDDDDGFEILTAEHLFSNLLSRVRDLTQKLNVEDGGGRPGFPSSRLLSHFDHGTNFWNFHNRLDPLSRHSSLGRSLSRERSTNDSNASTPWRRSVSRDLASDIESVFKDANTTSRPRDKKSKKENLNLADLDLKKLNLSDEDALALSYLTPGLSRRIQKHLLSQLTPSSERLSSTLPRRYSVENTETYKPYKSSLPIKRTETKLNDSRPKTLRSTSLREPTRIYLPKDKSPDSSLSESISRTDDFSTDSSISKYLTTPKSYLKTDLKPSTSPKRISRFLRPDFYDTPKEESVFVKEKKEREMETQKVLKEIRDKRKFRLNARRSASKDREKSIEKIEEEKKELSNGGLSLNNHDYVNVPSVEINGNVKKAEPVKKTRISKLVRPKSYPTETPEKEKAPKESKISKLKKGFTRQSSKEQEEADDEKTSHKNKLLQSIEKKLEKFRSSEPKEKKSGVESAIKRLREQSLPRNLEHCTESGLIKRAVSVEDVSNLNKPLQTSRKSVTKILGLFKKYEEKNEKKNKENNSSQQQEKKPERPRSLMIDKKNSEKKVSKLPVNNSFRRSLNLEVEPAKPKPQNETHLNNNNHDDNRNSITDDNSSVLLSPDENDSWSSDYHTHDLHSPVSPVCDNDNESVIDRIRRKSFYTRFNESKRARKPSLTRDYYGSLCYDYKPSLSRRSTFASQDSPVKRDYKNYTRSSSLLNDYVNVPPPPMRYQTYNAKVSRPTTVFSDSEDTTTLDELLSAAKSRKYSSALPPPSVLNRSSVSPVSEHFYRPTSSVVTTPTSPDPV